jgi:hypothetical protein
MMLYTLELVAVYLYFKSQRSKRDPPPIMFAVCFVLVVDTLATFAVCADVFSVRAYLQNFLRRNISSRSSYVSYFGVGQNSQLHLQALLILILRGSNKSFRSSLVSYCLDHLEASATNRGSFMAWPLRTQRPFQIPTKLQSYFLAELFASSSKILRFQCSHGK